MTLVSAVIPTYNRAELLSRALTSIARQDYRPLEVVVVDDGSEDDTAGVLERSGRVLEQSGIPLVSRALRANSGSGAARNVGLRLASGPLIAFLDSDDLWRPSFLSTVVPLLDRHPASGLVFCGSVAIDEHDAVVGARDPRLPVEPSEGYLRRPFEQLIQHMPFVPSGVVVRRTVFDQVGMFDETLRRAQDWDLWYRIAKEFDFAYTTQPLTCKRIQREGMREDSTTLACLLRVRLRHLDDVRDPLTHRLIVERLQRGQTALLEQLMRESRHDPDYEALLAAELGQTSMRYRVGRRISRAPRWLGRVYAAGVGAAGVARRLFS